MKIRRVEHDDYETEIVEEKKAEVATSSSASQTEREIEESDSASNFSIAGTHSNTSPPRAGCVFLPKIASGSPVGCVAGKEDGEEEKTLTRDMGPDAPTRPVRGRPPSKRAFHNFLAALRPLMDGASAGAVVARGADLWAAMDQKQRRPFRRAALRARRMRTHRGHRSGRSLSSDPRPRRRSRHPGNRPRSALSHHTIAFIPRILPLPPPINYAQSVRARALSVRSSPPRLPVTRPARPPPCRDSRPGRRLQRPPNRTRSRRQLPLIPLPSPPSPSPLLTSHRSALLNSGGVSGGGGLILRAALRMSSQQAQQPRPPSSRRGARTPRSDQRRRSTMATMTVAGWQRCSRIRATRQLTSPNVRKRMTPRRGGARSRSRSGTERRSRSRVRRLRPHTVQAPRRQQQPPQQQQQHMFTTFSIRQAPLHGSEPQLHKMATANEELVGGGGLDGSNKSLVLL